MIHPYIIAFLAISCYASLTVINKKMIGDIPPFSYIAITMLLLSGIGFVASFFFEKDFSFSSISEKNWSLIISLSTINFIGFALLLNAISKIPVVEYQIIAVMTPIVGGLLALIFLSEALTVRYFIGLVFIAIGLYISLKK